ncbi:hypothetical protein GCM10010510_68280 [Streptomyces anandii JCM 4720]|nr:hypothetical protein GCM10010510_68280 [Streptomyces anandii JCM 4720]
MHAKRAGGSRPDTALALRIVVLRRGEGGGVQDLGDRDGDDLLHVGGWPAVAERITTSVGPPRARART